MMYPLFFSFSFRRSSTERFTCAPMSLTGIAMSLVKTDRGAVSFGSLDLSTLLFFSRLRGGAGDLETLDLLVLKGESVGRVERPLRVRMPSLAVFDLGVGGLWM